MSRYSVFQILGVLILSVVAGGGPLQASPRLPVLAWNGRERSTNMIINVEYFRELANAGFTATIEDAKTIEDALRILDAAREAGVKLCLRMPQLERIGNRAADVEKIIKAVKDHPALESYFVKDEPRAQQFVKIGEHIKYLKQFDSTHGFYVNAFGNDASTKWLQTEDYPTYMKRYADEIGAGWFSFDMYPVTPEGKFLKNIKRPFPHDGMKKELKPTWFEQFETVLAFCKERKMPISAFALCTPHRNGGHWDYLPPSENEMKLELYVALAYGARHLQYFTFRSPNTNHDLFHNAPLDYATAKRTPIYDRVRNVNKELNSRAFVFLGAELPTVAHLGEPLPQGVKKFEKRPAFVKSLNVTDGAAVVSCFTNGKYEYLMVVNRELEKEITLKAEFIPGAERIAKDGSVVGTERQDGVYWLEVGAAEIFRIAK